jgi:hypothetical protein
MGDDHTSPDGRLRLLVCRELADVTVGFEGCEWHTHGDILAAASGLPEPEAVARFVDDVVADRAVIAVLQVAGEVRDAWVTDDPATEGRHLAEAESLDLRYWSGREWRLTDDG